MKRSALLLIFFFMSAICRGEGILNHTLTNKVNWKFLFNKLFALEIKKESRKGKAPFHDTKSLLKEHTSWSPLRFDEIISKTLKAKTSREAYNIREDIYRRESNYQKISELDFSAVIPDDLRVKAPVKKFLYSILRNSIRSIKPGENYFSSSEGQNMIEGITWTGQKKSRKVAFVLVPGYAAHLIKFPIFEEITGDANTFYGRPRLRPILTEEGLVDFTVEDHVTFYSRNNGTENTFDILSLAGWENGNTVGKNIESTKLLVKWLEDLPPRYKDHKFILLGYSKGAGVVFDVVRESEALRKRIIGFVTYGGVIQGTGIARTAIKTLDALSGDKTLSDLVDKVKGKDSEKLLHNITPLFMNTPTAIYKLPIMKKVLKNFGVDFAPMEKMGKRVMEGMEIKSLREGGVDMSPLVRTRWNLLHSNNHFFSPGTFIFNLSAVTDISTFANPGGTTVRGQKRPNILAPKLTDEGNIDWEHFSLDSIFLYVSSIDGFRGAPGGLYDTQVELGNTKFLLTDVRPLKDSLTQKELQDLWADKKIKELMKKNKIISFSQFGETPRNQLLSKKDTDHIGSFDLGEIRGHHWSCMVQALRPPPSLSKVHAKWTFPRMAYMRALTQVMALYNIIQRL
jgi:hypothetical protein